MPSGEGASGFCNLSVRSPRGQRWRKWQFSDHPETTIFSLAMVIRIVMTIASEKMTITAPLKTTLAGAENSGEKGAEYRYFVKDCYFCAPRDAPRRPRWPQKSSWFVEFLWKLRPVKRPLRLYIYTLSPLVLHKYTVVCKGFSPFPAMAITATESVALPMTATVPAVSISSGPRCRLPAS